MKPLHMKCVDFNNAIIVLVCVSSPLASTSLPMKARNTREVYSCLSTKENKTPGCEWGLGPVW
jgi:hypothetical protein